MVESTNKEMQEGEFQDIIDGKAEKWSWLYLLVIWIV